MAKQSEAAAAAAEQAKQSTSGSSSQHVQAEAPPPYSGPSQVSTRPLQPSQLESQPVAHASHEHWIPPANLAQARSRAMRRFWMAFFWAWVIYVGLAVILGGGMSDMRHAPMGRHGHWDKHGKWHEDWNIDVPRHDHPAEEPRWDTHLNLGENE
ncbi:hypothetical protein BD324DRAFT_619399 [Kockovaella imperatae]|uniref:Uncharacterized protein n=1 Tax=Kockovaella imperatae TaxID=4999 RepID=A0A1Y1UPB2_9TREE|nr:hypothetical protein BD324DRAFT_619399 [Kockovaella imperatae]ORX39364.1 hypothetical protein BD324DRAFT_619399 [Kockovaella imperatae]